MPAAAEVVINFRLDVFMIKPDKESIKDIYYLRIREDMPTNPSDLIQVVIERLMNW